MVVRNAYKGWALLGFSLSAPRAVAKPTIALSCCSRPHTPKEPCSHLDSLLLALWSLSRAGAVRNCPQVSHEPGAAASTGVGVHSEKTAKNERM